MPHTDKLDINLLLAAILCMCLCAWALNDGDIPLEQAATPTSAKIDTLNKDTLTLPNVYRYLQQLEIAHIDIVISQCILETHWLRCQNCCMAVNNLFGFKPGKEFLRFKHWKHSCDFYKVWQNKYYPGGDYYQFLNDIGYATDSLYTDKLKWIVKNKPAYENP